MAKSTKLHNSWVTFFYLPTDSKIKLKNNAELIENFKNSNYFRKFEDYEASIWKNVNKGIKRIELFDNSSVLC